MTSTTLLRLSYWVGAAVDGVAALIMIAEGHFGQPSLLTGYEPDVPYRYAMSLAGSLMLAWTILLLWADRKPVARRGVLPITCVLILGLMASGILAAVLGHLPKGVVIGLVLLLMALIVLFAYSYVASVRDVRTDADEGT